MERKFVQEWVKCWALVWTALHPLAHTFRPDLVWGHNSTQALACLAMRLPGPHKDPLMRWVGVPTGAGSALAHVQHIGARLLQPLGAALCQCWVELNGGRHTDASPLQPSDGRFEVYSQKLLPLASKPSCPQWRPTQPAWLALLPWPDSLGLPFSPGSHLHPCPCLGFSFWGN